MTVPADMHEGGDRRGNGGDVRGDRVGPGRRTDCGELHAGLWRRLPVRDHNRSTAVATDSHGNSASSAFTVTVTDHTAPSVTRARQHDGTATTPSGAVVTFTGIGIRSRRRNTAGRLLAGVGQHVPDRHDHRRVHGDRHARKQREWIVYRDGRDAARSQVG